MSRYYQYKNGEEVVVRPDLERGVQYYMRSGYRANDVSATLTYSQAQRLGTVVHIAAITSTKIMGAIGGRTRCLQRPTNVSARRCCEVNYGR